MKEVNEVIKVIKLFKPIDVIDEVIKVTTICRVILLMKVTQIIEDPFILFSIIGLPSESSQHQLGGQEPEMCHLFLEHPA